MFECHLAGSEGTIESQRLRLRRRALWRWDSVHVCKHDSVSVGVVKALRDRSLEVRVWETSGRRFFKIRHYP